MTAFASLVPRASHRAVFVGQTGSGKTTLARLLLRTRKWTVVLDAKGTLNWPGYRLITRWDALMRAGEARITYRPTFDEIADEGAMDAFFSWIYERQRTTVYVDELAAISNGDTYPRAFGACLMRGREVGVEVWTATQRPTRVPQVVLSESEEVFAFRLRLPQDRMRVEALTAIPAARIATLRKRDFIFAPQDGAISSALRLSLAPPSQMRNTA